MSEGRTLRAVRRLLLALLGVGLAGIAVELLLLGHDEDALQLVPLLLTVPTLAALAWHGVSQGRASARVLQVTLLALVVAGGAGVYLHGRASSEFQTEMDPSLGGLALLQKVLHAKAPPALAPGHMALLGLMGLAATYRQGRRDEDD